MIKHKTQGMLGTTEAVFASLTVESQYAELSPISQYMALADNRAIVIQQAVAQQGGGPP